MLFGKNKYLQLNMGLVEENYVIVKRRDIKEWKSRGFQKIWYYPIFHYTPKFGEVIMLGKPVRITELEKDFFVNSEILDICTCCGTYGMGGPGFLGIRLRGSYGVRWLTYCIWAAGEHILLDDRVLECYPDLSAKYSPWLDAKDHSGSLAAVKNMLTECTIKNIELDNDNIYIYMEDYCGEKHEICSHKYSEKFPEQGGTRKKQNSYDSGVMGDYWLVTYDETVLAV